MFRARQGNLTKYQEGFFNFKGIRICYSFKTLFTKRTFYLKNIENLCDKFMTKVQWETLTGTDQFLRRTAEWVKKSIYFSEISLKTCASEGWH